MPVHHTARNINFVSISSPVGTQIPQAVGTAMAARIAGKDDVALTYFGDGATSTGAFHVSCNFAAVRKAPCIFLCRNNGWAISSPRPCRPPPRPSPRRPSPTACRGCWSMATTCWRWRR